MNKDKVVKLFFGILFFSISINSFKNYVDFNTTISKTEPIVYFFIEKRINRGGRGKHFDMIIKYKNRERIVDITSKEYNLIEKGDYPVLFYSKNTDTVFSEWSEKLSLRVAILFSLISLISILPWKTLLPLALPSLTK